MIKNSKKLDQWYTKDSVAKKCVNKMIRLGFITKNTDVIEPSCGEGAFIRALAKKVQEKHIHAYDLEPKIPNAIKADWFETTPKLNNRGVVIGNPPYGKKGKLAVEFINHSLKFVDVVGFIVPITLSSSWTAQKHIRDDAELIFEMPLPKNSFVFEGKNVDVPSVFQIWRKRYDNLRLSKPETEHVDFETRIYNKTESALKQLTDFDWDIAVKRNSKKGEFITKGQEAKSDTHWILIKCKDDDILKKMTNIDWSKLNDNKMTAGMGKADVVKAYKEIK